MTIAKCKIEAISIIVMLIAVIWICSAGAQEASSFTQPDWLGSGPIYSYGNYRFPYHYPYYYDSPLIYSPFPIYASPFWPLPYSPFIADLKLRNPFEPWWVGTHQDLPRVLDIARSGSSMRVYVNGAWQTL